MSMNAPTKCPTCGSKERYQAEILCHDDWHREPAAPPEGETVQCLECGHAKESHFSAGSVQEVRYDDPPPSCHVCGTTTMRAFHCNLCGANTWPTNAAPPAGMATAEQLPWDEEDEQLLATSNGNVDLIAHLRGEVERVTRERDDLLAKLGKCLTPTGEAIERNRKRRARAALESTTPPSGKKGSVK